MLSFEGIFDAVSNKHFFIVYLIQMTKQADSKQAERNGIEYVVVKVLTINYYQIILIKFV